MKYILALALMIQLGLFAQQAKPESPLQKALSAPAQKAAPAPETTAAAPKITTPVEKAGIAATTAVKSPQILDIKKIFSAAPFIYSLLILMSIASMVIWLYSLATFRAKDIMPASFQKELRTLLEAQLYDQAQELCKAKGNLLGNLIGVGLNSRRHGPQVMVDAMKSEGKRASTAYWQRLSLLNDIVIGAPMLGLLGTVIGMFYAFYDVNRSIESINALFDGLGIAVGTTVVGLVVSILSMIFYTTLKYRVVRTLSHVENEAVTLSALIESKYR